MTNPVHYVLPTRKGTLIDAINARAAATGSPRYAVAASHANYNGHRVEVEWNNYRGYWIAGYTWNGRNVIQRGSFKSCCEAARAYYDQGDTFASAEVRIADATSEQIQYLTQNGWFEHSEALTQRSDNPLYGYINEAMNMERHFGVPALALLCKATSHEDYEAQLTDALQIRRARRQPTTV